MDTISIANEAAQRLPLFMGVIVFGLGYAVGNRFVQDTGEGISSVADWLKLIFELLWLSSIGAIPMMLAYIWGGWRLVGLFLLAFTVGLLIGVTLMPAVHRFQARRPNIAMTISGTWVMLLGMLYTLGGWRGRDSDMLWIGLTTVTSGLLTLAAGLYRLWDS